jgi:hypothetical protein
MNEIIDAYVASLNVAEAKALKIARDHLGSSFDIEKSIGFLAYIKRK